MPRLETTRKKKAPPPRAPSPRRAPKKINGAERKAGPGRGGARKGAGRKRLSEEVKATRNAKNFKRELGAAREEREQESWEDRGKRDYAAVAQQYAEDVMAGRIPACKWVKLACERHLKDLKRQLSRDFPYYWSPETANRHCGQIEKYPHIKGKWAGRKSYINLEPWQVFCVAVPFGWLRKENGQKNPHKRRYRKMYLQVPRKNGKSVLAAAIGNNMLTIDGEHGAEVYAGATSEKQAWEVFGPAKAMLEKSPKLAREFGIKVMARAITRDEDLSKFWPIIGKPGDGASPTCSIHDEYHEQISSDQLDTMQTGMGAREQPMLIIITTAGVNLGSPCYEEFLVACKVLQDVLQDEELFAIVYTIDEPDEEGKGGDDWASPEALRKANPNYGVSVDEDFLLAQQKQATQNPAYQNRFKTKHLNIWCAASVAGINMFAYKKCVDPKMSLDDFKGKRAWFALDLASKIDVCCYAKVFVRGVDGVRHYYAFVRHYLPEQTVEESKHHQQAYRKWHKEGRLLLTDGAEVDFDVVAADVEADAERYSVEEVVYDPWRATQLAHQLARKGARVVEMGQTAKNMGEAFDELTSAIKGGRFHHDGDPVLEWMASNVVAKDVAKGLTLPSKERKENKIDGVVAVTMAVARAMQATLDDDFMNFVANAVRG